MFLKQLRKSPFIAQTISLKVRVLYKKQNNNNNDKLHNFA
jgi:hypothetical protein